MSARSRPNSLGLVRESDHDKGRQAYSNRLDERGRPLRAGDGETLAGQIGLESNLDPVHLIKGGMKVWIKRLAIGGEPLADQFGNGERGGRGMEVRALDEQLGQSGFQGEDGQAGRSKEDLRRPRSALYRR